MADPHADSPALPEQGREVPASPRPTEPVSAAGPSLYPRGHPWRGLGVVLLAALLAAFLIRRYLDTRPLDLRTYTVALADAVEELLIRNHVPREHIDRGPGTLRRDQVTAWHWYAFHVDVPASLSARGIEKLLRKEMTERYARVAATSGGPGERRISLSVTGRVFADVVLSGGDITETQTIDALIKDLPATLPGLADLPLESSMLDLQQARLGGRGGPGRASRIVHKRVAIILDDGGYGGPATEAVLGLNPGLTLAILPYTPYARETAERATALGFEVMLHMPMESDNTRVRFPGWITTTMLPMEIIELTEAALDYVPGAAGVNNHTGSRFTGDQECMHLFLELLKGRSLYFVDSYTSTESKASALGAALGVPVGRRDVFLDNRQEPEYFLAQFDMLIDICMKQGQAIGICHFRPTTARVLAEVLPRLKEKGISLVHASELVR